MSFSIFISVLIPFFLAPFWTHELFKDSFEGQKSIIALDNAAILIGKGDRDLFNFIKKTNSFVTGIEKIHHPVHLAIRMGAIEPKLKAQDLGLETLIREIHSNTAAISNIRWSKSSFTALSEFQRLGISGNILERATRVPIVGLECSVCHLFSKWEVNPTLLKTKIAVTNSKAAESLYVYPTIRGLENNDPVNYKVILSSEGGL